MAVEKRLAYSIVQFLRDQTNSGTLNSDEQESLEVAIQCLETTFKINSRDGHLALIEPLREIFHNALLKNDVTSQDTSPSPEDAEKAEQLKNEGNNHMKEENYHCALECYTKAIDLDLRNAVYYSNRAAAHSKLGNYTEATSDCERAIKIDPTYSKAYGRMGLALTSMSKYPEAISYFKKALVLDPDNDTYKSNLKIAEQKLKEATSPLAAGLGFDMASLINNPAFISMWFVTYARECACADAVVGPLPVASLKHGVLLSVKEHEINRTWTLGLHKVVYSWPEYYTPPKCCCFWKDSLEPDQLNNDISNRELATTVLWYLVTDSLFVWVLVNTFCCSLMLVAKVIQYVVFGPLRVSEKQHLKDKFWNFIFYKFIFIFGVLNVQTVEEVVMWCLWFSALVFLHLMVQLCKDRFEYLSFSPSTPMNSHVRVLCLLVSLLLDCCGLAVGCGLLGASHGMHTLSFMAAECLLVTVRTGHVIMRYSIHLWDLSHDGTWESKGTYVYYTDFIMELAMLFLDLMHHIHMLLFGNIWLSMASLVIFMQLRYLFHEVQRRLRRHKNYLRVINNMEARFAVATPEELAANDDDCAICWDAMVTARKLPCGHLFHNSCLRSWLEQDTSCPTCRKSLNINGDGVQTRDQQQGPALEDNMGAAGPAVEARPHINQHNHFFHFDGSRIASWLPTDSDGLSNSGNVCPQVPLYLVMQDLQLTLAGQSDMLSIHRRSCVDDDFPSLTGLLRS
uniref:Small glutamine-rich tetratricopeptide repeat-containing protein beta n=1 Tax=Knipowitschia caucasica TaxID=637954 RepID=A0AAV2ITN9_KNICA